MKYRTIVADPPWPAEWHGGGIGRHSSNRGLGYSTMSAEKIADLPVGELADADAALFLWVPANFNREGVGTRVARAWGFTVVGEFVWEKGMSKAGHFPRSCHEIVLVGRRGDYRFPQTWLHSVQRWRKAPAVVTGSLNRHSAKPDALIDLVEQHCPGPYVELFSRRHRLGWDVHGFESANTASLESSALEVSG